MTLEHNAKGDYPKVSKAAFIHPSACLIGNVHINDNVLVGPHAVIRADEVASDDTVHPIIIWDGCNVQDSVVIHALGGSTVEIGNGTSIAHGAVVHGPIKTGKRCFIGFNSVVFDAELEDCVVVMHQALVQGVTVPESMYVPSRGLVQTEKDVQELERVPPEVASFVDNVRRVNLNFVKTWPRKG